MENMSQPNSPVAKKALHKQQKEFHNDQLLQVDTENPSENQINDLVNLYYSGQILKTELACKDILQIYPKSLVVINILGVSLQAQGKLPEALENYDKALELDPSYEEAYNNRGNALKELGEFKKALESYNKAIALKHDFPEAYNNRGIVLNELGQLEEAIEDYDMAIYLKPDIPEVYSNRGNTLKELGKFEKALESYNKAIPLKPDFAEAYNNRGIVLNELGELEKALEDYDMAIHLTPDIPEVYSNRGNTLKELGKFEKALESYNKAIPLKPDFAEAYNNRGIVLNELGELEKALEDYDMAIELNPYYAEAYSNRGIVLKEIGEFYASLLSQQKALFLNPKNSIYWNNFADILSVVKFTSYSDNLVNILLQILEQPTVDPRYITSSVISALHYYPVVLSALDLSKSDAINENIDYLTEQLSTQPLLLRVMELSSLEDLDIEKMFTKMRKSMLHKALSKDTEDQGLAFYVAMAMHCFVNEYIFSESEEEKQELELLQKKIKETLENKGTISPTWIAVLGSYRLLYSFTWAEDLLQYEWTGEIKKVIVGQISNIITEKLLRSKIASITSIEDNVSQLVRNQYEENPYPRWINTGLSDKPKRIGQVLQSIKLDIDFNAQKFSDKPNILVAGCGTGQHALITASMFLNSNVLAVDLSLSSLSYAARKTQELGVVNIEYMQGDILNLGQLKREFDIIESVGVLHHMDKPLVGWKVLANQLCTGGVMKIGLYSEAARQGITEARSQISKKGYKPSLEDIRKYRKKIFSMDKNSKIAEVVSFPDFYSLSECRDLLFHAQEHCFTLLQIEEALSDLGLKFLGFELKEDSIRKKFIEHYPEKDALLSLPKWHQFELENPNTFLHMYQFWVQKLS